MILHEGSAEEKRETHQIDLKKPTPIVFRLEKGRRKTVLPVLLQPERPVVATPKARSKASVPPERRPLPPR